MNRDSCKTLATFLVALPMMAYSSSAMSCSCIASKETAKNVREYIQALYDVGKNVVLLRAIKVTKVGDDREQAELLVVESWKGRYSIGDVVRSDTSALGAGMCDSPIGVGEEILMAFASEPVRIAGCPDAFVLTKLERKYLKRLQPKASREVRPQQ